MDRPHSKYRHVYAVVRFDTYITTVQEAATIVKVLPSRTLAEQEASRLTKVNKGKHCIYTVQTTRFVETL